VDYEDYREITGRLWGDYGGLYEAVGGILP
jgi:hypothetical protein